MHRHSLLGPFGDARPFLFTFLLAGAAGPLAARSLSSRRPEKPAPRAVAPDPVPLTALPLVQTGGRNHPDVEMKKAMVAFDGQTYAEAIQIDSNSITSVWLDFDLGRHYARFQTLVGVSDVANDDVSLVYTVIGDGRELYRTRPLRVGSGPERLVIDVTGVLRLRLQAETANFVCLRGKSSPYWVNPVVYRGGARPPAPTAARIILDGAALTTPAPLVDGEPCVPISVLQGLRGPLQRLEWQAEKGELILETQ